MSDVRLRRSRAHLRSPSRPAATPRSRRCARGAGRACRRGRACSISAPAPGRIGWPFVAAGDDYVGVDLSFGMLRAFAAASGRPARRWCRPTARAAVRRRGFDAVMLVQVFGGMRAGAGCSTRRGACCGRPARSSSAARSTPEDGVDARMKRSSLSILEGDRRAAPQPATRATTRSAGFEAARRDTPASSPRHGSAHAHAARLSRAPPHRRAVLRAARPVKARGARASSAPGPSGAFGSLDAASSERHAFELQLSHFERGGC